MRYRIAVIVFLGLLCAWAAAPDTGVAIKGAVAQNTALDAGLASGLPVYRRLVKVAGPDGQYRSSLEVEGYTLKDVLGRVGVKKVEDGFDRPLDTYITVKGRNGAQALLSYSEAAMAPDGGPLLVDKARLLMPHKHSPLKAGDNDPTVLRSVRERDQLNLQSCVSCHSESKVPSLSLPQGWLLVVPQDGFGGRFIEDVTEITVHQVGIPVKANREAAKNAIVEAPVLVGVDGTRTSLTPEQFHKLPELSWRDATFGMGRGFHGCNTWEGVDLDALLRPLLAGADPRRVWVLVTAEDGYRSLFSGSEVFAAREGQGVMLASRENGKSLGPGSGRYEIVSRTDFYIDRSVQMVKEIRIGRMQ